MDFTCSKIQSSRFSAFSLGAKLNIEARELLSKLTKFYTVQYETQKSQFMKKNLLCLWLKQYTWLLVRMTSDLFKIILICRLLKIQDSELRSINRV